MESLILAQSERWRRGLGMQVERTGLLQTASGERVSNTWGICPRAGDNIPKGMLIPHKLTIPMGIERKAGDRKAWHSRMTPRSIS